LAPSWQAASVQPAPSKTVFWIASQVLAKVSPSQAPLAQAVVQPSVLVRLPSSHSSPGLDEAVAADGGRAARRGTRVARLDASAAAAHPPAELGAVPLLLDAEEDPHRVLFAGDDPGPVAPTADHRERAPAAGVLQQHALHPAAPAGAVGVAVGVQADAPPARGVELHEAGRAAVRAGALHEDGRAVRRGIAELHGGAGGAEDEAAALGAAPGGEEELLPPHRELLEVRGGVIGGEEGEAEGEEQEPGRAAHWISSEAPLRRRPRG
jgi:hypothetical protein